jgi:hypothetical protein
MVKSSLCMGQDYKIMSDIELLSMIDDMNEQFEYYDKETMAKIFRANNKGFILLPAVGKKGLFANEQSVLDSILKSGVIPIEEENLNLFQKEKRRLEKINDNVDYYLADLNNKLQTTITTDAEIDASLYKIINKKIKSIQPEEAYQSYFIPLGIVVGEIIRREVNGEWKLDKEYGYNPYYVPYVTLGNNKNYLPWYKLADMLLNKRFDIKRYIESVSMERKYL